MLKRDRAKGIFTLAILLIKVDVNPMLAASSIAV